MRFPRKGLDMASDMTSDDPQNDPPDDPPDWSRDALPDLHIRPQISYAQNKGFFYTLLTVAEVKDLRAKDWIRPPTQSQE